MTQAGATADYPPTTSLMTPVNNSTISGSVTFAASATDDHGVTKVEFWCDGAVLLGTVTAAPYNLSYNTATIPNGARTFTCKAFDTAGNSSLSAANTVTVTNSSPAGPWLRGLGGTGTDGGQAVAVDGNGNVLVGAYFQGSVDFGGGVLTSAGGYDVVIAKYSAAGAHLWSRRFGGTGNEIVNGIALDGSGNIYLAGSLSGTGNLGGASLTSAGQQDAFLAKYSPQGDPLWSERFGGIYPDSIASIAVDSQGNVIATGLFQGTVAIGGTTLYSAGVGVDTFLTKYSPTGANIWAKKFTNGSYDVGTGVAVDKRTNPVTGLPYDNILLTGYFLGAINFGGENLSTPGSYLAKFGPDGSYLWAKARGAGSRAWAVSVDSNGDVAMSGDFYLQTDLGGGTILGTAFETDLYVAKYSGVDGSWLWSKGVTGTQGAGPKSMVFDAQNNIILTGYFYGTYNFGAQSLTSRQGSYDVFVAKYNSGGVPVWSESFGGTGTDQGNSVAVDSSGYPVVTGCFSSTASIAGQSVTSAGSYDGFVLRLDP